MELYTSNHSACPSATEAATQHSSHPAGSLPSSMGCCCWRSSLDGTMLALLQHVRLSSVWLAACCLAAYGQVSNPEYVKSQLLITSSLRLFNVLDIANAPLLALQPTTHYTCTSLIHSSDLQVKLTKKVHTRSSRFPHLYAGKSIVTGLKFA